eukprot:764046-Hanusia_phi.AAC.3
MAGAAGLLGAFHGAVVVDLTSLILLPPGLVESKVNKKIHLVLCLAENAIGPNALRNDDILRIWCCPCLQTPLSRHCGQDTRGVSLGNKFSFGQIDMATLTGAQLISTGKKHAALVCNSEELENRVYPASELSCSNFPAPGAILAGKKSGDLCHPLLFCPEFFKDEFKSKVPPISLECTA